MNCFDFNLRLLLMLQLVAVLMLMAEYGKTPWVIIFAFTIVDLIIVIDFLL